MAKEKAKQKTRRISITLDSDVEDEIQKLHEVGIHKLSVVNLLTTHVNEFLRGDVVMLYKAHLDGLL